MLRWVGWQDAQSTKFLAAYFLEREWANLYLANFFYNAQTNVLLRGSFQLGYTTNDELDAVVAIDVEGRLLMDSRGAERVFNIGQLSVVLITWARPYCLIGHPQLVEQVSHLYERGGYFVSVDYVLMRRLACAPYSLWQLPQGLGFKASAAEDFDKLIDLEIGYQKEEVMVSKRHVMNPKAIASHFRQRLALEQGFHLEYANQGLAKLSINIIGRQHQQVAGVYTHAKLRGKGLAKLLFSQFLHHYQHKSGYHLSLFVKQKNIAARRLYQDFYFDELADFRISYL